LQQFRELLAGLLPREASGKIPRVGAEGAAKGGVGKQLLGGRHEILFALYQNAGPAVDNAVTQAKCIANGGHPMLGRLHYCQTPPLFARRHEQGIGAGEQGVLIVLGHLAAKAHAIAYPMLLGIGTQVSFPPAGADDVQDRARGLRHRIHGMLDLFMRH